MTIHRMFTTDIFRSMFDALPLPIFMVNDQVMVQHCNTAAVEFLFRHIPPLYKVMHHVQNDRPSRDGQGDSWRTFFRSDASVAKFVEEVLKGGRVVRRCTKLNSDPDGFPMELETEITCSPSNSGTRTNVLLIFNEMGPIGDMKGLIPICAVCNKMIDEKETITQIEALAQKYEGVKFSHGLCAKCFKTEMVKIDLFPTTKALNKISTPGQRL